MALDLSTLINGYLVARIVKPLRNNQVNLPISIKNHENKNYLIIAKHRGPEYNIIVTDQDGNNLVFGTRDEAADCQDRLITELKSYTIKE